MTRSIFVVLILCQLLAIPAQARVVRRDEIQPFASGFQCDDEMLQWQFNHLPSLYDENQRMSGQSPRGRQPIVDRASKVGGDGDWLYRGVTNRQFNEVQILKLIFNDPTSVSESRWFTEKMFTSPAAQNGDLVRMRAEYQQLPLKQQCDAFQAAHTDVVGKIDRLMGQINGAMNGFSEHVRVGSSFNGTPQAIQFLTPHKDYAEGYGEFVLHIREVVKRGIDVERYNYHNPSWGYTIGSIYRMDRDEYMVPSHIPAWDVQTVKVRDGTGWHKGSYGPPLYYYTKVTADKNPCKVLAIQIDKPGAGDGDRSRIPVGILLPCPLGKSCVSRWDDALPASHQARLKSVVEQARVKGRPLYYTSLTSFTVPTIPRSSASRTSRPS